MPAPRVLVPAARLRAVATLLAAGMVVAVAACTPVSTIGPTATVAAPSSPVVGIVTSVTSAGLSQVSGFTLRTSAGQILDFTVGQLENGDQFPPGHLGEHQITAEPIEVWFQVENGRLVAYRLADAAASGSPSVRPSSPASSPASGAPSSSPSSPAAS